MKQTKQEDKQKNSLYMKTFSIRLKNDYFINIEDLFYFSTVNRNKYKKKSFQIT